MKILVTGSSGLIGSALVPALRADGHEVRRLVRRPPRDDSEIQWDPAAGRLDPAALAGSAGTGSGGIDAAVNLAGAGIGDRRWTDSYRNVIRSSRTAGTRLLATALAGLDPRPSVLLSGSAVGWYGRSAGTDEQAVDETGPSGTGFLADLVRDWEAATRPAKEAGIRVVHLRTGIVLSGHGGTMGRLLPLFRLGLGGQLGSGRQWMSWISRTDVVDAIRLLLAADGSAAPAAGTIAGPVNLVAPEPVTNAEFTRALGRTLGRPTLARVPRLALRVALGEFADEGVLASQRLAPGVLLAAGFRFSDPDIALAAVVRGET